MRLRQLSWAEDIFSWTREPPVERSAEEVLAAGERGRKTEVVREREERESEQESE